MGKTSKKAKVAKIAKSANELVSDKAVLKGYICGTETLELSGGMDMVVYASVDALKRKRTCWPECGIEELIIETKTIYKGDIWQRKEAKQLKNKVLRPK